MRDRRIVTERNHFLRLLYFSCCAGRHPAQPKDRQSSGRRVSEPNKHPNIQACETYITLFSPKGDFLFFQESIHTLFLVFRGEAECEQGGFMVDTAVAYRFDAPVDGRFGVLHR